MEAAGDEGPRPSGSLINWKLLLCKHSINFYHINSISLSHSPATDQHHPQETFGGSYQLSELLLALRVSKIKYRALTASLRQWALFFSSLEGGGGRKKKKKQLLQSVFVHTTAKGGFFHSKPSSLERSWLQTHTEPRTETLRAVRDLPAQAQPQRASNLLQAQQHRSLSDTLRAQKLCWAREGGRSEPGTGLEKTQHWVSGQRAELFWKSHPHGDTLVPAVTAWSGLGATARLRFWEPWGALGHWEHVSFPWALGRGSCLFLCWILSTDDRSQQTHLLYKSRSKLRH